MNENWEQEGSEEKRKSIIFILLNLCFFQYCRWNKVELMGNEAIVIVLKK